MSSIESVLNDDAFDSILLAAGSKLVVVDFYADWCQPCHMIKPKFKEFAGKYSNAKFIQVDVDQCQDTAESQGVTAMPTFLFFKNNIKVDTLRGADAPALEEKILKWNTQDTEVEDSGVKGQMDLVGFIESKGCELLNGGSNQTVQSILKLDSEFVLSDCDEQLIVSVAFNQVVKLHSLKIYGPMENGPKTIKIFTNQQKTLDFDSADTMAAMQELELTVEDIKAGSLVPLRFVKFQNVSHITLFIKSNQNASETTKVDYVAFIGNPAATTNMNEFKRVTGKKGESH